MKRALITGGGGMLGHAVSNTATRFAPEYSTFSLSHSGCELMNAHDVNSVFDEAAPNVVIHLAARVGGIGANMADNYGFFVDNMRINMNVVEWCRRAKCPIVAVLSSCIYPYDAEMPLRERDLHRGEPHPSNYGYAYAKRMFQVMCRAADIPYVCLVPTNIYGKNDNYRSESSHVIPAIIRKVHEAKMSGGECVLWGDGSPLREFSYADDVAECVWLAATTVDTMSGGRTHNIGSREEVSIRDVAQCVCDAMGFDFGRVVWDRSKPNGIHRKPTDKAEWWMNHVRWRSIREGIPLAAEWYEAHYENARRD